MPTHLLALLVLPFLHLLALLHHHLLSLLILPFVRLPTLLLHHLLFLLILALFHLPTLLDIRLLWLARPHLLRRSLLFLLLELPRRRRLSPDGGRPYRLSRLDQALPLRRCLREERTPL